MKDKTIYRVYYNKNFSFKIRIQILVLMKWILLTKVDV